ncbi:MAG: hypothetical protein O3A20_03565 [Planctomycetota bacterium]|nr:hypothetical protein [Planctomycetota bacterium]
MLGVSLLLLICASPAQQAPAVQAGSWVILGPVPALAAPATDDDPLNIEKRLRRGLDQQLWSELSEDYAVGRGREKRRLRWLQCEEEQNRPPEGGAVLDTPELDFNLLLGTVAPANEATSAYLYRGLVASHEGEIPIRLGSDDGVRVWLNGVLLLDRAVARGLSVNDEHLSLPLRAGLNHLLIKVVNVGGAWKFQMKQPKRVDQALINEAIDRGVTWLLDQQLIDGSWPDQQAEYRNGTTALALYTLLKSGVNPRHPAVLQALAYLQSYPAEKTYVAGCQLMAAAAMHDPQHEWWAEETAGDLLSWQEGNGGWSYPSGHDDLSLTQYAALGLRAAEALGIEVPPEVWSDMAEYTLIHQESWRSVDKAPAGGFRYRLDHGFTGSMTTAGISILSICKQQLGDRMKTTIRREVDAALAAGGRWLDRNIQVNANPGDAGWHFYYLYGLERCGALLNTETFGGIEWYWDGAEWLLAAQGAKGQWGDARGWHQRNTCFALLFLERATARAMTQPDAQQQDSGRLAASDPAAGPVRIKVVRQTPAVFWIESEATDIQRVEYFLRPEGGEWKMVLESTERRFAGRWSLPHPGVWEARAEAICANGARKLSGVVRFTHDEGLGDERLAYATDSQRNRLPTVTPQVTASSEAGGFPATNVADNFFGTRWVCAGEDADPWIELRLRKAVRSTELRLSHSRTCRAETVQESGNARPVRVELWLEKGGEPLILEIDPDPFRKTILRFPEPKRISYLKIRIVGITDGELGKGACVGFTEIELHESR